MVKGVNLTWIIQNARGVFSPSLDLDLSVAEQDLHDLGSDLNPQASYLRRKREYVWFSLKIGEVLS